jgi:hypothetical protein
MNTLPDVAAAPKLLELPLPEDRFIRYAASSLEAHTPLDAHVDPLFAVPIDLIDPLQYERPRNVGEELDPEDKALLVDEAAAAQSVSRIERIRPTVSWLRKANIIGNDVVPTAPPAVSGLRDEPAADAASGAGGEGDALWDADQQIQEIERSFETARFPPSHAKKPGLTVARVWPLLAADAASGVAGAGPSAAPLVLVSLDQAPRDAPTLLSAHGAKSFSMYTAPDAAAASAAPAPSSSSSSSSAAANGDAGGLGLQRLPRGAATFNHVREFVSKPAADASDTVFLALSDDALRIAVCSRRLALRKRARTAHDDLESELASRPASLVIEQPRS